MTLYLTANRSQLYNQSINQSIITHTVVKQDSNHTHTTTRSSAATIWNSLPHHMSVARSFKRFRQSLRTHLYLLTFHQPSTWPPAPTIQWSHVDILTCHQICLIIIIIIIIYRQLSHLLLSTGTYLDKPHTHITSFTYIWHKTFSFFCTIVDYM